MAPARSPGVEAGALQRVRGRELMAQEKEGKCMPVCPYAGDGGSQEATGLIILRVGCYPEAKFWGLLGLCSTWPRENCPRHKDEH